MSFPLALTPPIAGAFAFRHYAGFGILGADIPTTGDNGGSPVLNDDINPTAEYHWRVETPPSAGTLVINPDLSCTWDGTGLPDGAYPWVYRLFENNASQGTATVQQTVGSLTQLVAAANAQQSNTASPAAIKQTHKAAAAHSVQANQASPVSVTSGSTGIGSLSEEDVQRIAAAVLSALNATTIPVDIQKIRGQGLQGDGSEATPWNPA